MMLTVANADGTTAPLLDVANTSPTLISATITVIVMALLLGRFLKLSWKQSLALSMLCNIASTFLCPLIVPPEVYFSQFPPHTGVNPNPCLLQFELVLSYSFFSILVEYPFWIFKRGSANQPINLSILGRCCMAHLISGLFGLVILSIPSRPFRPLEFYVIKQRQRILWNPAMKTLENKLNESGMPTKKVSAIDLLKYSLADDRHSVWSGLYLPAYHRFSMGETTERPMVLFDYWSQKNKADLEKGLDVLSGANGFDRLTYKLYRTDQRYTIDVIWDTAL